MNRLSDLGPIDPSEVANTLNIVASSLSKNKSVNGNHEYVKINQQNKLVAVDKGTPGTKLTLGEITTLVEKALRQKPEASTREKILRNYKVISDAFSERTSIWKFLGKLYQIARVKILLHKEGYENTVIGNDNLLQQEYESNRFEKKFEGVFKGKQFIGKVTTFQLREWNESDPNMDELTTIMGNTFENIGIWIKELFGSKTFIKECVGTFNQEGHLIKGIKIDDEGRKLEGTFDKYENLKEGSITWPNGMIEKGTFDEHENLKNGTSFYSEGIHE